MLKSRILIFLFLFSSLGAFSQTGNTSSSDSSNALTFSLKPTIGVGVGQLSFFGDIKAQHYFQDPMLSRIVYTVYMTQSLTDYLSLNLQGYTGKLGANEHNTGRNLNFESQITGGGINLQYNFDNILPASANLHPYVSLGFESFEFLSKTDLYDKYGNKYYYWTDGTIRNMPQNSNDAQNAIVIERDYKYESDIRALNLDGFGKYSEQSFGIPIGAGANLHLSDHVDFSIGTALHYTFTDYIDGITSKSLGDRKGNSRNDMFLMSTFSLSYHFGSKVSTEGAEGLFSNVNFAALDTADADHDGVPDFKDSCAGTPLDVAVNASGCPLDSDHDGVPDYRDKQPNSPAGVPVNADGIAYTDSMLLKQYEVYTDTTGKYAAKEVKNYVAPNLPGHGGTTYTVQLGVFKKGISPDQLTKFLAIKDIATTSINDSTTAYTAGIYNNYNDAYKRQQDFINQGIKDAIVVNKVGNQLTPAHKPSPQVSSSAGAGTGTNGSTSTGGNNGGSAQSTSSGTPVNSSALNQSGVVFRVQLGAFSKRINKNKAFPGVHDLIEAKTRDGLYKYMAGAFSTFDDAAKYKVDLIAQGHKGAFITAYKDGKRVPLTSVGATPAKPDSTMGPAPAKVDKNQVVFKVQIGVFKNTPPANVLNKFKSIPGLKEEKTATGLTKYVVGSFHFYEQASALKDKIKKQHGIKGAFVIASYKGKYISVPDAIELLK